MTEKSTILLRTVTINRMKETAKKSESYDDFINRILDERTQIAERIPA